MAPALFGYLQVLFCFSMYQLRDTTIYYYSTFLHRAEFLLPNMMAPLDDVTYQIRPEVDTNRC